MRFRKSLSTTLQPEQMPQDIEHASQEHQRTVFTVNAARSGWVKPVGRAWSATNLCAHCKRPLQKRNSWRTQYKLVIPSEARNLCLA
jgi:hypothetical protein